MNASYTLDNVSEKSESREQKQKKRRNMNLMKWLIYPALVIFALCLFTVIAAEKLTDGEQLVKLEEIRNESGFVSIEQMPAYLPKAFVGIEDHRFYDHVGVDPISMVRAFWVDIKTKSFAQGGSTITMQLAKNQFLTQEKSINRKFKELLIAIHLDRIYTKEEILEMYLNTIYFGHGKYGIEEAANFYLGKTLQANDLGEETITLSEAAMLASLPKAPEYFSPIKHPEEAFNRQAVVLNRMNELGMITENEKEAAVWKSLDQLPINQ
ncbi:transglycosylase domain-containing protein [Lederbergia lenta]|uniref:transglycosylase domain-containing protein n=1 Tax=Lederbergia lenta TaxID=1467 RepID=UPI0020410071|nr:transglycosylase domain-containing protein [Lederbergia lenta]MCM3112451.1 transglycosylase domain-containing protein [Lederbergia lenta]